MLKIAVDSGTTNTRILILQDNEIVAREKCNVGNRNVAMTGSKKVLEEAVSDLIHKGLDKINKKIEDVSYVVGSGMITSNLGLIEIPHLEAPVSIENLSKSVKTVEFRWLQGVPFHFITGVKNRAEKTLEQLDKINVMRGEEVETIGIMDLCDVNSECLIILPGSHTKFVYVDHECRIVKCLTTMLGEMFTALVEDTILSDSIPKDLINELDQRFIKFGIDYECKHGLSKAAFAARLLHIQLNTTPNERANFLGGALVSNDLNGEVLEYIRSNHSVKVLIGGSTPLRNIFEIALLHKGIPKSQIMVLDDSITQIASFIGAFKIIESISV